MKFENYMILEFPSKSCNEAFARAAVACFAAQLDPTVEELGDIRTAVSEAVTNAIVHAYPNELGIVSLRCRILKGQVLDIVVKDKGVGIPDIEQAMQAGFSTAPDTIRSLGFGAGMGLPNMKRYTDYMDIQSTVGVGTTITMRVNLPEE